MERVPEANLSVVLTMRDGSTDRYLVQGERADVIDCVRQSLDYALLDNRASGVVNISVDVIHPAFVRKASRA